MKHITILVLLLSVTLAKAQESKDFEVFFETGKHFVDSTQRAMLRSQIAVPIDHIVLTGHTDKVGSYEANLALSKRRVEEVATLLTGHGIDPALITTNYRGETQAQGDEQLGDPNSRRVTVTLFYPATPPEPEPTMPPVVEAPEPESAPAMQPITTSRDSLYAYLRDLLPRERFVIY